MAKKKMNFNLKRHKKKSKRKKKGSRKQNNKVNTSAIEKGLSSLCIAKENKATEGATAKFLENSSDRNNLISELGLARQRKKERCRLKNLRKKLCKMDLSRSKPESDISPPHAPNEVPDEIEKDILVTMVTSNFLKHQKDSKKCFKKIIRRERSKQRIHKNFAINHEK